MKMAWLLTLATLAVAEVAARGKQLGDARQRLVGEVELIGGDGDVALGKGDAGNLLQLEIGDVVEDIGEHADDGGYVCVCMDWWPSNKCDYGLCPWKQSSILSVDLENPKLVEAMKGLGEVKLRIGGTQADTIVYEDGVTPCLPFDPPPGTNSSFFKHGCLTMKRWDAIVSLCRKAGCSIVFGINAMHGRDKSETRTWDPSNARALIQHIVRSKQQDVIFGFEYGNELNINAVNPGLGLTPKQIAEGYHQLHDLLKAEFGEDNTPKILGPDNIGWQSRYMKKLLSLSKDVLYGVTWHAYPLGPSYDNPLVDHLVMSPGFHDIFFRRAAKASKEAKEFGGPDMQIWMGESGGAFNSGRNNTSNRFLDSFWYLNTMAALAQAGHQSFCRQTLIGGNYELLDKNSLGPNPDYFAAVMFRKWMGRHVHRVTLSDSSRKIRAYAHCNVKTKIQTIMVLNFDQNRSAEIDLDHSTHVSPTRDEYHFTAPDLHSATVDLNGVTLLHVSQLKPRVEHDLSRPLALAPQSYAFVVFHNSSCRPAGESR
ncbi:Heparanase-like protein 3 [Durusdinium trenchii]|uniref:Heparanase-like protein 3 n=1 Tax=Durusdinium trenchii TaxID=1381693 RepID=A0ABP0IG66_9DINO